jgi:hypothetical protein
MSTPLEPPAPAVEGWSDARTPLAELRAALRRFEEEKIDIFHDRLTP